MLFVEFRFFVFFALIFCVHWALPSNTWRKAWLLACSYVFYTCFFIGDPGVFWEHLRAGEWSQLGVVPGPPGVVPNPNADKNIGWWFPFVLMGSTCMDYAVGLGIADAKSEGRRKAWLLVSLAINLGVLCFFKYFNFFISSAESFLGWLGLPASEWTLKIFLPYGISFYTFQSMSYSIDVYRRRLEPVRKFLDLAFFISFFPQLVAGPIVRAMTFLPQVFEKRRWENVDVRGCLTLFFIGYVKKRCVSENVAPVVDEFFNAPWNFNAYSVAMAVLFYAVQIYCDFSGYTDMAIATARLLGYELTINFDFPYFSRNITDFWRRWHISLSTWLRDYLYISLGGNRGTKLFTYRNLMLTMVLGGLWHGASWNFIIWGAMHGFALIVHREWQRLTANANALFKKIMGWLAMPLTFYWVCLAWIYFRAVNLYTPLLGPDGNAVINNGKKVMVLKETGLHVANAAVKALTILHSRGKHTFGWEALALFVGLALMHWLCYRRTFTEWWRRTPDWLCSALLGIGTALALLFSQPGYKPFIYIQF